MDYLINSLRPTQREALPGQTENSAGGFSWEIDCWSRLRRFLILGSEGGSYYVSERKLTTENLFCLRECVAEDGPRTVQEIVQISDSGRAPKNDPAIFGLAFCASEGGDRTRSAALGSLQSVCRTGTHLFTFARFVSAQRGWGRGLRKAVGSWYLDKDEEKLALQLVKYRQREGWSHRDLLRLSHPKATGAKNDLLSWAVGKGAKELHGMVGGHVAALHAATAKGTAELIREFDLPREAINPEFLKDPLVWDALLEKMPLTAMIRNLGNMSKCGLVTPYSDATGTIVARLLDQIRLKQARVHPIQILAALLTYRQGHGTRGSGEWDVAPQIVDALDDAFHLSFGNVEPTGQRVMLALDVSGSMSWGEIAGVPGLTPRLGSAAMALITARTEARYEILAFSDELVGLQLTAKATLSETEQAISNLRFGGTDCALPIQMARQTGREVDLFVVYTDSETWSGGMHPAQALKEYRRASGIDAKLVVVGMVSNGFTIADPNDDGMLDVVGFDTATPNLLTEFAHGF